MNTQEEILNSLLQTIERLEAQLVLPAQTTNAITDKNGFLRFTEKETSKMPKEFRRVFRLQGYIAHVRKRCDYRYNCSYEIRYNRDGYNISASATTLELAKQRFIEKAIAFDKSNKKVPHIPKNFEQFAMYWFENFHRRKVCDRTYTHDIKLYHRYISSAFCSQVINTVTPYQLQNFLDVFNDRPKTKNDLRSILNQIFVSAVKHGLLPLNPLGMVFHSSYDKQHGKALTKQEEMTLLQNVRKDYQLYFAIALYTGLRPNEFATATIAGEFIKAVNSKRHNNGQTVYKRIPITPKLKPYIIGVNNIVFPSTHTMTNAFKKVLPFHKLYDMRTTFQTRCSECDIPDNVIGLFMGNSIGKLKEAYTDFTDEYLIKQGQKFTY